MTKDKSKKPAKPVDIPEDVITSEYDPEHGYWIRSEEGDIIRSSGCGYWSKEPPKKKDDKKVDEEK